MNDNITTDNLVKFTELQAKTDYKSARKELASAVIRAKRVSRGAAGVRSETAQHFWASVLFTRMLVTAMSIQKLLPDLNVDEHWDFSAVASITRNLAECYLFLYFLSVDDIPQVEKDARIIMLNLHDNASRRKLFGELGEPNDDAQTAASKALVHEDLVSKFNANTYLSGLPEKRQKELIKGEKTPFVQDDMIERCNLDKTYFRFLYRLFSQHAHTGPVAFYRMADHGHGHGFQNRYEAYFMAIALRFASDLMRRATVDVLVLFPGAEVRGSTMETPDTKDRPKPRRRNKIRERDERDFLLQKPFSFMSHC